MTTITNVSPTLRAAMLNKYDSEENAGIRALKEGYSVIEQTATAAVAYTHAARNDTRMTSVGAEDNAHKFALKSFDKAAPKIDSARARALQHQEKLRAQIMRPLHEATAHDAREIRDHLKAMPKDEREALVSRWVQQGDLNSLSAVLLKPAYLSGVSEARMKHWLHLYQTNIEPGLYAQIEEVDSAVEHYDRAARLLMKTLVEDENSSFMFDKKKLAYAAAAEKQYAELHTD